MSPHCGMQDATCGAPASSPAAQYFCNAAQSRGGAVDRSTGCFAHDTTAWCSITPLSNNCPMLQPFSNGDCKNKDNVLMQYGDSDVSTVGVHYGPSSICIGVPGGTLKRDIGGGASRQWAMSIACVASECRADGVYLLIKDTTADSYTPHLCQDDGYLELGVEQSFPAGVRSRSRWQLLLVHSMCPCQVLLMCHWRMAATT